MLGRRIFLGLTSVAWQGFGAMSFVMILATTLTGKYPPGMTPWAVLIMTLTGIIAIAAGQLLWTWARSGMRSLSEAFAFRCLLAGVTCGMLLFIFMISGSQGWLETVLIFASIAGGFVAIYSVVETLPITDRGAGSDAV